MQDVAREAGVHRSTVYEYFPGRDPLFVAAFARESAAIYGKVSHHLRRRPMIPGLIDAIAEGLELVEASEFASLLLGRDGVGPTVSAAAASEAWDRAIQAGLTGPVTAAVDGGEVRSDVPVDEIIRWIVRVALSVTSEPPADLRLTLHRFLAPSLVPPALRAGEQDSGTGQSTEAGPNAHSRDAASE